MEAERAQDRAEKAVKEKGFRKASSASLVAGYRDKTVVMPLVRLQAVVEEMGRNIITMDSNFRAVLEQLTKYVADNTMRLNKSIGDLTLQLAGTQEYLVKTIAYFNAMESTDQTVQKLQVLEDACRKMLIDEINKLRDKKFKEIDDGINAKFNLVEVTDRAIQVGDIVNIKYVGSIGGKEFVGGSSDNQLLRIGSRTFIPGFEESLVDSQLNQTGIVHITLPANYEPKELAGKEADFEVTVLKIRTQKEAANANAGNGNTVE